MAQALDAQQGESMRRSLLVAAVLCLAGFSAAAQQYPSRPDQVRRGVSAGRRHGQRVARAGREALAAPRPAGRGREPAGRRRRHRQRCRGEERRRRLHAARRTDRRPGDPAVHATQTHLRLRARLRRRFAHRLRHHHLRRAGGVEGAVGDGLRRHGESDARQAQLRVIGLRCAHPPDRRDVQAGGRGRPHARSRTRARRRSCPTCSTAASTWRSTARRRICRT